MKEKYYKFNRYSYKFLPNREILKLFCYEPK